MLTVSQQSDRQTSLRRQPKPRTISGLDHGCGNRTKDQTVNDGVAHSRIGTLDQPVAA